MKLRRWRVLSALGISLILLTTGILGGCSSSKETSTPAGQEAPKEPAQEEASGEKTLIVAELSDAAQLDPQKGTDIPSANVYHGKVYEGLVAQNQKMETVPLLATEWKQIDDLTWEFKLREGVTFHDGAAFNAEAVKKSFERILDPNTASPRKKLFDMISEMKVIDEYTIQFVTAYPYAPLLANLSHYSAGIISPTAIDQYGDDLGLHPTGTGPFVFDSWTPGSEIIIKKNPNYWGNEPQLDKIVFQVIPEDATRIALVETGKAHIAEPVPVDDVQRIESSDVMALYRTDGLGIDYLGFNTEKEPFTDVRVRQAINYAVDVDAIVQGIYNNVGTPATAPMGPGVWGHNPNVKNYPYDINKAKELLADAGYPDGFKTTIWTNDNKARVGVAEVVQSQLKGIGINAEIKVLEWGAYLEATEKGEHDMFILGWSNMTGDADYNQFFLFHSDARGKMGNNTFFSNERVDELIDLGRKETDPTKRLAIYAEAQEIEMQEAPMIFLRNDERLAVISKDVQGFWIHPSGILMLQDVSLK